MLRWRFVERLRRDARLVLADEVGRPAQLGGVSSLMWIVYPIEGMNQRIGPRFGSLDDTTPEAREHWLALLRKMTPEERFANALAASHRLREFTNSGLRLHHPTANTDELDRMYAERVLPSELCRRFLDAFRVP